MLSKVYVLEVCDGVHNVVFRGVEVVVVSLVVVPLGEQRVVQLRDFQALVGHPQ